MTDTKQFNKLLFALAIPIMLQNLMTTLLNMLDSVMIGRLSENVISAVTLANQPFLIINFAFFGISSGVAVLTTQYWGKGNTKAIAKILAMGLVTASGLTLIFASLGFFIPERIMSLYSKEPEVIKLGAKYLKIASLSYIPTAISTVTMMCLRSVEQIKKPLMINVTAIATNTVLNYLLIFGKLGLPRLEERGAAIATLIARTIEMLLFLAFLSGKNSIIRVKLSYLIHFDKLLVKDFIKFSLPVVANELLWGIGTSVQTMAIGHLGKMQTSAWAINTTLQNLAFVACIGVCNAIGIMIGKAVGVNDIKKAKEYIKKGLRTVLVAGLAGSILVLLLRAPFISLYNIQPHTKSLALSLTAALSVVFFIKCFACTYIVGILRGAGDSRFAMIIDLVFLWALSIPLGYIAAFKLAFPLWAVYLVFMSDELIKTVVAAVRVARGEFFKNVTREEIE